MATFDNSKVTIQRFVDVQTAPLGKYYRRGPNLTGYCRMYCTLHNGWFVRRHHHTNELTDFNLCFLNTYWSQTHVFHGLSSKLSCVTPGMKAARMKHTDHVSKEQSKPYSIHMVADRSQKAGMTSCIQIFGWYKLKTVQLLSLLFKTKTMPFS